jgi:hypothetical protein
VLRSIRTGENEDKILDELNGKHQPHTLSCFRR